MSSTIQTKNKKRNNKNDNLHKAKSAKNDEFYTTRGTIEDELKWYKHHFKGKVVYCNCDDPYESEFFKYFMLQFKMLGLKKLIATCYKNSPVANKQLQLFSNEELLTNRGNKAHKIEITSEDLEGENPSMENMKDILKRKKLVKNLPAKCDGSFDSKPCLKLLEEADIVVTNPPFSQFRQFVHVLEKYHKDFLIIGNMNAVTYKEIFPLIKENKLWLGYTHPKEFFKPDGTKKKFGNIMWYTNLDIPKRHHDLDMWKDYNAEDYPHYDNYDAINVDKVSEIPKDYCESWGLYSEEYKALDKTQWEEVRREQKDDTELIYVIPKEGAELRKLLHEHADGYKETIEKELANSIYCNGCMGVPITMLDKYNPKQLEIVKFRKGDDEKDLTYTEGVSPLEASKQASRLHRTSESLSERYCNGIVGVPITFLDKWSAEQIRIIGIANSARWIGYELFTIINDRKIYNRLVIQKVL